jgi:hypothetical protein
VQIMVRHEIVSVCPGEGPGRNLRAPEPDNSAADMGHASGYDGVFCFPRIGCRAPAVCKAGCRVPSVIFVITPQETDP